MLEYVMYVIPADLQKGTAKPEAATDAIALSLFLSLLSVYYFPSLDSCSKSLKHGSQLPSRTQHVHLARVFL